MIASTRSRSSRRTWRQCGATSVCESIDVIGLSFGGLPAVEFALEHPGRVRRLVLSNAQISAASWQRTNIDGVNLELQRLFPEEWRRILRLRAEGVRSLDPEYQGLIAQVLPDLEWVDPWGHPPLEQPDEGGFEERVYSSVIGADPEWVVDGTLRGYDPIASAPRDPRTHAGDQRPVRPSDTAERGAGDLRRARTGAAPATRLRTQRAPPLGRAARRVLRCRRSLPGLTTGNRSVGADVM